MIKADSAEMFATEDGHYFVMNLQRRTVSGWNETEKTMAIWSTHWCVQVLKMVRR